MIASGASGLASERERSTTNPASASTKTTLPNSDGWNVKKPTLIQRCEPRVAAPATSTKIITASVPK